MNTAPDGVADYAECAASWRATMTLEVVLRVLRQAQTDDGFRRWCLCNPDRALAGYDLTPQERAVLWTGDAEALALLGVQRTIARQHSLPTRCYPAAPDPTGGIDASWR